MSAPALFPVGPLPVADLNAWLSFLNPIVAQKTADETVTSSVTLQNDDALFASVNVANAIYAWRAWVKYRSGTTELFKLTFTAPAGATGSWAPNGLASSVTGFTGSMNGAAYPYATAPSLGAAGAAQDVVCSPSGLLILGATTGLLQLQWAQSVSGATSAVVKSDSHLLVTRVA